MLVSLLLACKNKRGMWGAKGKHVRNRAHLTTVWALALRHRWALSHGRHSRQHYSLLLLLPSLLSSFFHPSSSSSGVEGSRRMKGEGLTFLFWYKTNPEAHWFLAHRISKTMRDSSSSSSYPPLGMPWRTHTTFFHTTAEDAFLVIQHGGCATTLGRLAS